MNTLKDSAKYCKALQLYQCWRMLSTETKLVSRVTGGYTREIKNESKFTNLQSIQSPAGPLAQHTSGYKSKQIFGKLAPKEGSRNEWDTKHGLMFSSHTVLKETNGTKPSVWRDIGVVWAKITYLKSAVMLFLSDFQRDMAWGFLKRYRASL